MEEAKMVDLTNNQNETKLGEIKLTIRNAAFLNSLLPFHYKLVEKEEFIINQTKSNLNQNERIKTTCLEKRPHLKLEVDSQLRDIKQRRVHKPIVTFEEEYANKPNKIVKKVLTIYDKCQNIINKLKAHKMAGPFIRPLAVNTDFLEKFHNPIDLTIVQNKLLNKEYKTTFEFALDIRKIWCQCQSCYPENSPMQQMCRELIVYFEKLFLNMENLPIDDPSSQPQQDKIQPKLHKARSRDSHFHKNILKFDDRPMTIDEKTELKKMIMKLRPEKQQGVLNILKNVDLEKNDEKASFDIDTLSPRKCRELEKYVKQNINVRNKPKPKIKFPLDNSLDFESNLTFQDANRKVEEIKSNEYINSGNTGKNLAMNDDNINESGSESSFSEVEDDANSPVSKSAIKSDKKKEQFNETSRLWKEVKNFQDIGSTDPQQQKFKSRLSKK